MTEIRDQLPAIRRFMGHPVRVFRVECNFEMGGRYGPPSPGRMGCRNDTPSLIQTWGIPRPDFAAAVGYTEEHIRRIIQRSPDVFAGLYLVAPIMDALGRRQPTTVMAYEMCMLLVAKLETSRIVNPEHRERVVGFQRWVVSIFHMLRSGRIRPGYWKPGTPVAYQDILCLPMGAATHQAVVALAKEESKSVPTIYRRLQALRGTNAVTHRGVPKRSPRRTAGGSHR